MTQMEVDAFVERQLNFDPDIWVVDIDDSSGTGLLSLQNAHQPPEF